MRKSLDYAVGGGSFVSVGGLMVTISAYTVPTGAGGFVQAVGIPLGAVLLGLGVYWVRCAQRFCRQKQDAPAALGPSASPP